MSLSSCSLVLLALLHLTSGQPKIIKDDSEGRVIPNHAAISGTDVAIKNPRPEVLSNISEIGSSLEESLSQSNPTRLEKQRNSDLQKNGGANSDNTETQNFHGKSEIGGSIHMRQESSQFQNTSTDNFDKKELPNSENSHKEEYKRKLTAGNEQRSQSGQSFQSQLSENTNIDNAHHSQTMNVSLRNHDLIYNVAFTNGSTQITDVLSGNSSLPVCTGLCCNITSDGANCTDCHLKCVPTDLPKSIKKLLLARNNINKEGLFSRVFANYAELEELDLAANNITYLPEGVFDGLENLQILNIHNNSIILNQTFNDSKVFYPLNGTLHTLIMNKNTKSKRKKVLYPDKALSVLRNLSRLHIDGLKDKDFGIGFSNLTKLTHLSLSPGYDSHFCLMKSITNKTFLYLSYLISLNISDCNLQGGKVHFDAFSHLTRLQVLDVSNNLDLGIQAVGKFMFGLQNNANFVHLKMPRIVKRFAPCIVIYKHTLRFFQNSSLQVIEAMDNEIEMIEQGALDMLPPTLKLVNLTNNRIMFGAYWKDMASLTALEMLYLDGYLRPVKFPLSYPSNHWQCNESNYIVNRKSDQEYETKCTCSPGSCSAENADFILPLPPKLKNFTMHSNSLAYTINNIKFCPTNSLTSVDLSGNMFQELQGPITGLNKIQYLNLSSCFIETIKDAFFDNLTSLEYLNLFQNLLGDCLNNDTDGKIFDRLHNLKYLNLSFNNMYRLNIPAFKDLENLEVLDISINRMSHINFSVEHMKNLRVLDLHKNDISSLPKDLRDLVDSLLSKKQSVRIDMSANPIICDCSNLEFLEWIIRKEIVAVFGNNFTYYYCKYPMELNNAVEMKNGFEKEVIQLRRRCSTHVALFCAVAGGTLLMVIFTIGLLLYRFRWTLRYWFHAAKLKVYSNHHQKSEEYEYDVFISYASEDVDFVLNELSHQLSSKRHLKLMVHGETFQTGRHITDNIYMAVRQCRKTLVLMTKTLLTSHWCTYELQMARMESISTGRDVLLFVFLEDIPAHLISVEVMSYIKTSTYIMYPIESSHREAFWNKLANDIRA